MNLIEIHKQLLQIPSDIGHQINYLQVLCELSAHVAEIIPDVKARYNDALATVSEEVLSKWDKKSPATLLNNIVKGRLSAEQKEVDFAERINATISKQIDAMRTCISYGKGNY
jgi:hypothetical protein